MIKPLGTFLGKTLWDAERWPYETSGSFHTLTNYFITFMELLSKNDEHALSS